jgi:hypothetical protein
MNSMLLEVMPPLYLSCAVNITNVQTPKIGAALLPEKPLKCSGYPTLTLESPAFCPDSVLSCGNE